MLHVNINKSHVNIIMLHVDIIYLACRGQKYATISSAALMHRKFSDEHCDNIIINRLF